MQRTIRLVVATVVAVALVGTGGAGASGPGDLVDRVAAADREVAPSGMETITANPWTKTDAVGDAARPGGDLTRIVVRNGRQSIGFTFRLAGPPPWDAADNDRITFMSFIVDRRGTDPRHDREVSIFKVDGSWNIAILNRQGNLVCSRAGGVNILPNATFRIAVPVNLCMGGARMIRVNGAFYDDQDDTEVVTHVEDQVPQGRYGPFIRLPRAESGAGATATGGWATH